MVLLEDLITFELQFAETQVFLFGITRNIRAQKTAEPSVHALGYCGFCAGVARSFYNFQISLLYSAIVRSDEKKPALLMFTSIFFAHAFLSS